MNRKLLEKSGKKPSVFYWTLAETDKLGYFINTVTQPVLAKERQVVKNEKRQGVDNCLPSTSGRKSLII